MPRRPRTPPPRTLMGRERPPMPRPLLVHQMRTVVQRPPMPPTRRLTPQTGNTPPPPPDTAAQTVRATSRIRARLADGGPNNIGERTTRLTRFLHEPHNPTGPSEPPSVHVCGFRPHPSHFGRAASSALRCRRYSSTLAFQHDTHSDLDLPPESVTHPCRPPLASLAGLPHVAQSCRSIASTCSILNFGLTLTSPHPTCPAHPGTQGKPRTKAREPAPRGG